MCLEWSEFFMSRKPLGKKKKEVVSIRLSVEIIEKIMLLGTKQEVIEQIVTDYIAELEKK